MGIFSRVRRKEARPGQLPRELRRIVEHADWDRSKVVWFVDGCDPKEGTAQVHKCPNCGADVAFANSVPLVVAGMRVQITLKCHKCHFGIELP